MKQSMYVGLFTLCKAQFRATSIKDTLLRFLEQAVFASLLIFALSGNVIVSGMHYTPYLLLGLAPWFYLEQIIMGAPKSYNDFSQALRMHGKDATLLPLIRAFSALPTLLFWQSVSIVYILFTRGSTITLSAIPYYIICNIINAVAQGQMAIALLPIIEDIAGEGFSLMTTILFWSTPIAWPIGKLSGIMLFALELNPLYYIAETGRGIFYGGYFGGGVNTALFLLSVGFVYVVGLALYNALNCVSRGGKIFSRRVDI